MRNSHFFRHCLGLGTLAAALIVSVSTSARAQRVYVGPQVGYNLGNREAFFSMRMSVPMSRELAFYPSVDVYTPERGTRSAFNADLKFLIPTVDGPRIYAGAGLNAMTRTLSESSRTTIGTNVLAGIESRAGRVRPYLEYRLLLQENTTAQFAAGLNITLGR